MSADGPATAAGDARIEPGIMAHLHTGNTAIELSAAGPNRFFLIGGVPLGERLSCGGTPSPDRLRKLRPRDSWIAGDGRFGEVRGYAGDPLPAPPLPPGGLKAR